jgi:hypothetical protein
MCPKNPEIREKISMVYPTGYKNGDLNTATWLVTIPIDYMREFAPADGSRLYLRMRWDARGRMILTPVHPSTDKFEIDE